MRLLAAAFLLAAAPAFAKPKKAKTPSSAPTFAGIVVRSTSKIAPGGDGKPVFREGRLTMTSKADESTELKATPRTKVTLDGKPAKFSAATPGTFILRADVDPATKELRALDLKSAPKPADEPGTVNGEIAVTDVLKGTLSVRLSAGGLREYAVGESAAINAADGKSVLFESLKAGDAVEVESADGKSAAKITVRPAP